LTTAPTDTDPENNPSRSTTTTSSKLPSINVPNNIPQITVNAIPPLKRGDEIYKEGPTARDPTRPRPKTVKTQDSRTRDDPGPERRCTNLDFLVSRNTEKPRATWFCPMKRATNNGQQFLERRSRLRLH
jgi:hypothetical protein